MKNKKIWLGLICAFIIVCIACMFQVINESKQEKLNEVAKIEATLEAEKDKEVKQHEEIGEEKSEENAESNVNSQNTGNFENTDTTNKKEETHGDTNNLSTTSPITPVDTSTNTETPKVTENVKNESTFDIDKKTGMDKYNTSPVPEGKPVPVEWQDVTVNKDKELKCTLSISCGTILDNKDDLNPDKAELVPEDGIILASTEVVFYEGESVFNVLLRETKKKKIHMEFVMTPIYNSNYIEGIANLYEFDCGELSGWIYKVNSWVPNYGCSRYILKDGDIVEWVYTCDLGRDVGAEFIDQAKPKDEE